MIVHVFCNGFVIIIVLKFNKMRCMCRFIKSQIKMWNALYTIDLCCCSFSYCWTMFLMWDIVGGVRGWGASFTTGTRSASRFCNGRVANVCCYICILIYICCWIYTTHTIYTSFDEVITKNYILCVFDTQQTHYYRRCIHIIYLLFITLFFLNMFSKIHKIIISKTIVVQFV